MKQGIGFQFASFFSIAHRINISMNNLKKILRCAQNDNRKISQSYDVYCNQKSDITIKNQTLQSKVRHYNQKSQIQVKYHDPRDYDCQAAQFHRRYLFL